MCHTGCVCVCVCVCVHEVIRRASVTKAQMKGWSWLAERQAGRQEEGSSNWLKRKRVMKGY